MRSVNEPDWLEIRVDCDLTCEAVSDSWARTLLWSGLGCLAEAISFVGTEDLSVKVLRKRKEENPKDIRKVLGRYPRIHRDFKAMVKDLEQQKKELQEMLREREDTVATLEARNQILVEANKTLRSEIKKASKQLVRFQESRASQDRAISRIKQVTEQILGYMKELEAKIEKDKQQYEEERKESAELERMVLDLEKICEAQENQILSLEERFEQFSFGRLEMDSLL